MTAPGSDVTGDGAAADPMPHAGEPAAERPAAERPTAGRPTAERLTLAPGLGARERRAERVIAALFLVTALAGIAVFVLYLLGGQTQLEGIGLAVALGSLGLGIVWWARELLPEEEREEPRHPLGTASAAAAALDEIESVRIGRRTLLVRTLGAALGGLAAALAIPVLSLGPAPGPSLYHTAWRKGSRLVGADGQVVLAESIPLGGVSTVFPEAAPGSAESQALLINVGPGRLQLPPDRMAWAPDGFVVYSKVCTHAGCPVGLYRSSQGSLICPCHQSTFDVLHGAVPTFGPAARPLPQLPIQRRPDGSFVALGDFPEPVGPGFWDMYRGG
jgi:quinol---cytochrome c reductase iron-sulfur subunit